MKELNQFEVSRKARVLRLMMQWAEKLRGEEGADVVEFAISSFIFFLFTFGLMYLCFIFFMYQTTAEAAREGARWASVHATNCDTTTSGCPLSSTPQTDVSNYVQGTIVGASGMTVNTYWCVPSSYQCTCVGATSSNNYACQSGSTGTWGSANLGQGDMVRVTVSYTVASIPFVSSSGLTISSSSQHVLW